MSEPPAEGGRAGRPASTVEFRRSGIRVDWDPGSDSLLELAEEQGLNPDFNCRAGICSTCKSVLIAGRVTYFEEPLEPPGEGMVLLCCARPDGPVVLDL